MSLCPFCLPAAESRIILRDDWCYAMWTVDTGTPLGSAMVLPLTHRPTLFALTREEWNSTADLLQELKAVIDDRHRPDGYNIGWNAHPVAGQSVMHAHCHLVPRYADEPFAGRGIRSWIKDPANRPPRHRP